MIAPVPPSKTPDSMGRTVVGSGRAGGDLAATLSQRVAGIKPGIKQWANKVKEGQ
jgi:hypothetical protein